MSDSDLARMRKMSNNRTKEKQAEEALRESESRLQAVFAAARNAILMMDSEGFVTFANQATYDVLGYQPKEVIGRSLHELLVSPSYLQEYRRAAPEFRRTGKGAAIGNTVERKARHKDGHEIDAEISLSSVKIKDEWHAVGIVRDITARLKTKQEIIAARNEAERANLAKSEFLSNMSHELRTPMNVILGFGQLMQYDDSLPQEHQDNVKEIMNAGYHLLDLINEILDLAKIEAGHVKLTIEELQVCALVKECLGLINTLAAKRNISISYDCPDETAVLADRTRLKQVLLNLLSNAVKYNHPNGSIHVDTQPAGEDRLRIQVTDTGIGISPQRLTELFQPFNRLDAANSEIEGSGIGLTISHRFVEKMGGSIDVYSEVGKGSCFRVELPVATLPTGERQTLHADVGGHSPTLPAAKETCQVLYIEDNPVNVKLVEQILNPRQEFLLLTACEPELGLQLARVHRPDVILLDINMPQMDGYQVLNILKTDPATRRIPVIAITANAMASDIKDGLAAGFDDYLTKPLDVANFLAVLENKLQIRAGDG